MPNLMSSELAAVASAFLVFWVAPTLLSALHAYRRRAALSAASHMPVPEAGATAKAGPEQPLPAATAPPVAAQVTPETAVIPETATPVTEEVAETPTRDAAPDVDEEWQALGETGDVAGDEAGHRLRFGELRHAPLEHWPPDAVRHDPERSRAWLEAERFAHQIGRRLDAAEFVSPFPARACCFAGGNRSDAGWRLRFLLFTELWPEQESQAEAAVDFSVSADESEVSSQVSVRRR